MWNAVATYWYSEDQRPNGTPSNSNNANKPPPPPPPPKRPPPPSNRPPPPRDPPPPTGGSAMTLGFGMPSLGGIFGGAATSNTVDIVSSENPPRTTTATTASHPYPVGPIHAKATHPYSLSTPLLKDERASDPHRRKPIYTFDPIKHHYVKSGMTLTSEGKKEIVSFDKGKLSSCAPMKMSFDISTDFPLVSKEPPLPSPVRPAMKGSHAGLPGIDLSESKKEESTEIATDEKKEETGVAVIIRVERGEKFLEEYLNSLPLSQKERKDLWELHQWISHEKLSLKMSDELCLGDLMISYFSHFSPTNPDQFGCWKRWITYLNDSPLKDVNFYRIREFFDTGLFNVAYDKAKRPVMIVNTKHYDHTFGPEITAKAVNLFLTSLLWDLSKNEFDWVALRKGINIYVDLSHYSVNMLAWNVISAVKNAAIAYPFQLLDIYCVNAPTFIYLLKQIAAKVVVPHAMEKIKIFNTPDEYFTDYGVKSTTPVENGGTWQISTTQWMKSRGYLGDKDQT